MTNSKTGINSQAARFNVPRLDWLGAVARDASLPCMAARLAIIIIAYVNNKTGIAWPSQDTLAKEIGASVDTVRRSLNALVGAGHLVRLAAGGPGHSAQYRLNIEAGDPSNIARKQDCYPSKSAGDIPANPPLASLQDCCTNSLEENSLELNSLYLSAKADESDDLPREDLFEEIKPKEAIGQVTAKRARKPSRADSYPGADDAFAEFWSAYPRKVAKAAAAKAFASAIKGGADADVLIRGAKRYAAERMAVPDEAERERFTAHPATWLSAGRWADEATAPAGSIVIDGTTGEAIHQPPPRPQQGYSPRQHVDAFAFGDRYGAEFDAAMGG